MQETPPNPTVLRYFLAIFLAAFLLMIHLVWPFLSILIFAYLLSRLFLPVYTFLNRRISATLASLLTCILISILVFIPIIFFIGALYTEALLLYQSGKLAKIAFEIREFQHSPFFTRILEILATFGVYLDLELVSNPFSVFAKTAALALYNQASTWTTNLMAFIFNLLMMILTIFFLLIDHDRLINYLLRLSPLPDEQIRTLLHKFDETTRAVFLGNGVTSLVQGVLGGILFAAYDLGPPVLWGGIMAILAFLPIFGIGLILIPISGILILKGNLEGGLLVLGAYLLITIIVEYVLKTKMVGTQAKMHSLLVLIAIIGGLSTYGLLGILYGPLIITAFLTLADSYMNCHGKDGKAGGYNGENVEG